jgi:hypothetical protein
VVFNFQPIARILALRILLGTWRQGFIFIFDSSLQIRQQSRLHCLGCFFALLIALLVGASWTRMHSGSFKVKDLCTGTLSAYSVSLILYALIDEKLGNNNTGFLHEHGCLEYVIVLAPGLFDHQTGFMCAGGRAGDHAERNGTYGTSYRTRYSVPIRLQYA